MPMISTSSSGPSCSRIFSLSAICGTAFGETKLTASICRKPAATRPRKYSAFRSVGICRGSPCHASRGHSMSLMDSIAEVTSRLSRKCDVCRAATRKMPVVLVEKKTPQITVVTLNRPERRNALSIQLLTELIASIKLASDETRERIVILSGAGAAFCTGLDLKEAQDQTKAHATADLVAHVLGALNEARPVTIAAVHGAAVAGGAGIMSACDYVVAAEGTKIGYPETRRGLVAGLVMTFLRRQLRERDMREL